MSIPIKRLGRYEMLAHLGSGGMGSVYKAHDTRLDRPVAIKRAATPFSDRIDSEARAAAALNHLNICQIYDIGPDYFVMELVEGSPLAPLYDDRTLLDLAVQLADPLAAAHESGIVHRDLKPSNVLVTANRRIKVLDFGVAVAGAEIEAPEATCTVPSTGPHSAVGSAAYMSPEQARGERVDARTDLWSLGVVLYELATGVRPFDGPTPAVVLVIERGDVAPGPSPSEYAFVRTEFQRNLYRISVR